MRLIFQITKLTLCKVTMGYTDQSIGRHKANFKTCTGTVNICRLRISKLWHQSSTYAFIIWPWWWKYLDDWALSPFLLLSLLFHPLPLFSLLPPLPPLLPRIVCAAKRGRSLLQVPHTALPFSLFLLIPLCRSLPLIDCNSSWCVRSVWTAFDCVLNQSVTNCSRRGPFIRHGPFSEAHAASPCF